MKGLRRDRLIKVGLWNICRSWDEYDTRWRYGLFHDHDGYLSVVAILPDSGKRLCMHRGGCDGVPPDYLVGYLDMLKWAMSEVDSGQANTEGNG